MDMIMIKDAAKNLGVESHVLRYWEEELGLEIKRNSMGHRFYDERDIKLFKDVKDLRERGFSLKDIKDGIDKQREKLSEEKQEEGNAPALPDKVEDTKEISLKPAESESVESLKIVDFKTAQLQNLMNKIVANALKENKDIITASIKSELTTDVMRQFDTVMREKEEKEEERYRKLDETIRMLQKSNEEVAATRVKKGLFGRRKK